MADGIAQLRRKIGSATDLQSVVRAMKAQSAASVGQYALSVAALGDYARTVELGLGACLRRHPLAADPPPRAKTAGGRHLRAVVFGSDQGLVGRFNETLAEYAMHTVLAQHPQAKIWVVGQRMRASLSDVGLAVKGSFDVPVTVQSITRLVGDILGSVVEPTSPAQQAQASPELHLFYNRPTSGSACEPVGQRLLPLDQAWQGALAGRAWPTPLPPELLGSPTKTVRALVSEYVFVSLFRAGAASLASENSSRLAAMERADRNIDQMLKGLNERAHRLRQSQIDEELSDVISGFKALSSSNGRP